MEVPTAPPDAAQPIDPPAESASAAVTTHAIAPAPAIAAPETSGPAALTLAGITVSGSLDAYATFNPARTASSSGPNDLYAFETQANGASVSLAKIALERKAAPVGFRLDVGFGSTIDVVNSTDAVAGHDIMRNLEQAFVSWAATPSLTLKVGKMVTHHGMEVIESQANWNYTRSLLFTWAIPFTQTGLAVDWSVNDKLEATLFVVNGLNNTFEGNAFKSPGFQVIYKPSSALTLTQNFSAFNEQPGEAGGLTRFDLAVYLFDTVATYTISDAFEVAANSDIGYDASLPSDHVFVGVASYLRWHASSRMAVSGRAEYFHDNDSPTLGILLPMKGSIVEGTATVSYAPAEGLLLRAEARLDRGLGNYEPFTDRAGMMYTSNQQATLTLGAVAAF
ncbi:MAG: outer membrane beta-barrel protein [Kofleriaceae bacterium]